MRFDETGELHSIPSQRVFIAREWKRRRFRRRREKCDMLTKQMKSQLKSKQTQMERNLGKLDTNCRAFSFNHIPGCRRWVRWQIASGSGTLTPIAAAEVDRTWGRWGAVRFRRRWKVFRVRKCLKEVQRHKCSMEPLLHMCLRVVRLECRSWA